MNWFFFRESLHLVASLPKWLRNVLESYRSDLWASVGKLFSSLIAFATQSVADIFLKRKCHFFWRGDFGKSRTRKSFYFTSLPSLFLVLRSNFLPWIHFAVSVAAIRPAFVLASGFFLFFYSFVECFRQPMIALERLRASYVHTHDSGLTWYAFKASLWPSLPLKSPRQVDSTILPSFSYWVPRVEAVIKRFVGTAAW